MNDQQQLCVKMVLDAWTKEIGATNALLEKLSDEQLMQEVSPTRNRGVYLLGHLTAEHDEMLSLLRFQEAMYPELMPMFMDAPDKTVATLPSILQLRAQWKTVNDTLMGHLNALPAEEWFTRHPSISDENFLKEPHRDRLNVSISRTSHLAYHRGQLALLEGK